MKLSKEFRCAQQNGLGGWASPPPKCCCGCAGLNLGLPQQLPLGEGAPQFLKETYDASRTSSSHIRSVSTPTPKPHLHPSCLLHCAICTAGQVDALQPPPRPSKAWSEWRPPALPWAPPASAPAASPPATGPPPFECARMRPAASAPAMAPKGEPFPSIWELHQTVCLCLSLNRGIS